ncbi:MAG TPA: tRNA lysidine(34) synthetase TilS [Planctomycetaceae bacterium]|jgi:tRNA(Ile)-lysidine synthase|nr:tRNA lysidine(34) synthetase TilS [Planctomycetaceae bacterium]
MQPTNFDTPLQIDPAPRIERAPQVDGASFLTHLAAELDLLELGRAGILVGVSGGADSVSLLRGLHALVEPARVHVVAAHLNHAMRRVAADDDAAWIAELCRRLSIPVVVEKIDVPAYAAERRLNIEEAARTVRYEFFVRAARAHGCTHIAAAHTADDQVETVLHHLFRGTGLAGLRGMRPARPLAQGLTLVRPLLRIRRAEIEAWLSDIGQEFRTDATNADESRTRNRIRHSVLPALERELGTPIRDSLLRMAEQASELQSTLEILAERLFNQCLEDETPDLVRLNAELLEDQPRHLVREVFVFLWKRKGWPRQAVGFDDWDRLANLVSVGGSATLPGNINATRRGKLLVIRTGAAHR